MGMGGVVKDIPVDLLKVFGIDFDDGQNLIFNREEDGKHKDD